MILTSFGFLFLVLCALLLYYLPSLKNRQVEVLILASVVFYGWGSLKCLAVLLFSAGINFLASYYAMAGAGRKRLLWATVGVVFNLSVLFFFKYSPLLARTFLDRQNPMVGLFLRVYLPVGLSFYTFQGISLMVDSYRNGDGRHPAPMSMIEHFKNTFLYLCFFPKILAGPIEKADRFFPQIEKKEFGEVPWDFCFKSVVTGYFLKSVVADNLKNYTFWIDYPYFLEKSSTELLLMVYGYSIQIFADFAGYSLIAIGVGGLFGYWLQANFDFPYISQSFSEFWRRWHMSLSGFLKTYLYIPLGGNRKGNLRTYANLMIVMALGGLWHGGAWSFAVWGIVHGTALAVERFFSKRVRLPDHFAVKCFKMAAVFAFVTSAWLLFKLQNFAHAIDYLRAIATNTHIQSSAAREAYIILYSLPVALYHFYYLIKDRFDLVFERFEAPALGAMLFFIATNSGSSESFVYFQF